MDPDLIARECAALGAARTRGELGELIASLVLSYSPRDMRQMRRNFASSVRDFAPGYRRQLEESVGGHLDGTYQAVRRLHSIAPEQARAVVLAVLGGCTAAEVAERESIPLGTKNTANICGLILHGLQNAHHSRPPNATVELQNGWGSILARSRASVTSE